MCSAALAAVSEYDHIVGLRSFEAIQRLPNGETPVDVARTYGVDPTNHQAGLNAVRGPGGSS
jgi:hypothetical protein